MKIRKNYYLNYRSATVSKSKFLMLYVLSTTDTDIGTQGDIPPKYYYYFNYAEDHSSYPLISSVTNKIIKFYGTNNVVGFLSLSGNSKNILIWIIQINKDKNSQRWTSPKTLYYNSYEIKSIYYKVELNYVIIIFLENRSGVYYLNILTKKLVFDVGQGLIDGLTNPAGYILGDGNSQINSKYTLDTFTSVVQITGYSSTGKPGAPFQVVLDNHIYTYRWDFSSSNQNIMLKNYKQQTSMPISYFILFFPFL